MSYNHAIQQSISSDDINGANDQTAVFPTEIFDLVIDDLAISGKNRKDLLSCSLVSKSFHYRVRHHIFSKLELLGGPQFQSEYNSKQRGWLQTLLHLLEQTDSLLCTPASGRVQTLVLGNIFKDVAQFFRPCWLLIDPTLPSILRKLDGVQKFVFKNTIRTFRWDSFAKELSNSIQQICASPALRSLEIQNVSRLPHNFIPSGSRIQELSLTFNAVVCKPSSEDFTIFPMGFDIGSLKSLGTLTLVIGAPFTNTAGECRLILPKLCQYLRVQGTVTTPIETINITIGYDIVFECNAEGDIDMEKSKRQLAIFDEVLASPNYSSLKTVRLALACKKLGRSLDPNIQSQVETYIQEILPALRSNSAISLKMTVIDYVI